MEQPELRSNHNGKGVKKKSYTLAEKQEYVQIWKNVGLSNGDRIRKLTE